jgi:hypothetical protein
MRLLSAFLGSVVTLAAAPAGAAHARAYTVAPGRYESSPKFHVLYAGSGTWHTDYHSNPPNPGGNPDTNDAHDSSVQHWSLRFLPSLRLGMTDLSGARGRTSFVGLIQHQHVDGLYSFDNGSIRCRVHAATARGAHLGARLEIRQSGRRIELRALIPVSEAVDLVPGECPGQGDAIDGLANNYFMPGFSFAAGYGPERWFRSAPVSMPLASLQRASRVTFHLRPAAGAAPPRNCVVPQPSYERCRTTGRWRGTLTLIRRA